MGNTLGGKKTTKIMKINGETIKFKTPIKVGDVVKDYPGHVVLDSEAVKHYGIRAKPLDSLLNLEPKRLYFLVELPKLSQDHQHRVPRRVRSGIQMSARDRLESLVLSRRSVSDLSIMGPATRIENDGSHGSLNASAGLRVKMRLPKAEVERLMSQSKDRDEMVEKIMNMYSSKLSQESQNGSRNDYVHGIQREKSSLKGKEIVNGDSCFVQSFGRSRAGDKKRVGFMPIREGEIGVAIAT
ncbi:uncharacterized protein At1g66480-like [Silene latifolia]|uniref:uncharacterized protein At1g66480-like n=1 Tax=Silene latifolia TaxID=37657 RepID=UPI003D788C75